MAKAPDVFVWTKIGDEAGELIRGILMRKDAERRAGSFWWGIGSSLNCDKLKRALNEANESLPVFFSEQLTPPKKCGFGGMRVWTRWIDQFGHEHEIPDHAMVISKGRSEKYYSLVCHSEESILTLRELLFDHRLFRNYEGKPLGNSQNTALLTGNLQVDQTEGRYRRGFWATLVQPWLVKLRGSRQLKDHEQRLIVNWDGDDYASLVNQIRG